VSGGSTTPALDFGSTGTANSAGTTLTLALVAGSIGAGDAITFTVSSNLVMPTSATSVTMTVESYADGQGTATEVFQIVPLPSITLNPTSYSMVSGITFSSVDLSFKLPYAVTSGQTISFIADAEVFADGVSTGLTLTGASGTTYATSNSGRTFTLTTDADAAAGTTVTMNLGAALMTAMPMDPGEVLFNFKSNGATWATGVQGFGSIIHPPSSGSDPLAKLGDRQVEFQLPPAVMLPLVAAPDVKIFGSVFEGLNSDQQWFDRMIIETTEPERFMEIKMKPNLHELNHSKLARFAFQTLDVYLGYGRFSDPSVTSQIHDMSTKVPTSFMGQDFSFQSVSRTHAAAFTTIGSFPRECVDMAGPSIHMYICSSPATEFFGKKRPLSLMYAHLDMMLVEIKNCSQLTGVLPEIWGLQLMSKVTEGYLKEPLNELKPRLDIVSTALAGGPGLEIIESDVKSTEYVV